MLHAVEGAALDHKAVEAEIAGEADAARQLEGIAEVERQAVVLVRPRDHHLAGHAERLRGHNGRRRRIAGIDHLERVGRAVELEGQLVADRRIEHVDREGHEVRRQQIAWLERLEMYSRPGLLRPSRTTTRTAGTPFAPTVLDVTLWQLAQAGPKPDLSAPKVE